jgi:hypothetical protein
MEAVAIGRVLRASTVGFACGTRSNEMDLPSFGAFVTTLGREPHDPALIGLIYAIRIDDDPLIRQLIMANHLNAATIRDQRENRMVPVEISVVNIGYQIDGASYHSLPPRPPISLDPVYLCGDADVRAFTQSFDFFRLVLNAPEVPAEELMAAAIRQATAARPAHEQRDFLVRAGRRLATMLANDLPRLDHLLRLIRP